MRRSLLVVVVVLATVGSTFASVGCGGAAPIRPTTAGQGRSGASSTVEVAPIVVSPYTDADLAKQFEHARALLLAGKTREAVEIFDWLVRLAPDGRTAPPSLYNGGLAHEELGDHASAADRHRELARRFPDHELTRPALFRLARLAAYLERWDELVAVSGRLNGLANLTVLEAIEAHGAQALGLIEQNKVDEATREVQKARDAIEENRLGEAGKPPLELAQVSFALGEIRRKKSELITFVPVPKNFAEVLEMRCQGLLDAQNAFTEAMRSLDAHWSAMAGYRVGQLYQQLHRDVMQVPPPAGADTLKKKQLFEGAMRLRYRVLLEKGMKMMDGTVRIGERTGESSLWILRAREAKRNLELALDDEKRALGKLPFTEAELQQALDSLKKPTP